MTVAVASIVGLVVVVGVLAVRWRAGRPDWMGLEGRTLWDWTELSLEAVLIGVATVAITATQVQVESSRVQSEAVQRYLDRVTALVTDEDGVDEPERLALVRAHTTEVLRVTSVAGAGRVVVFLDELDLLPDLALDLSGADLTAAELKGVDLSTTEVEGLVLAGADLEDAVLAGMDLEDVDLSRADLKDADLRGVTTEGTDLGGVRLSGADLRGADLRGASGLDADSIDEACTNAATALPDGLAGDVEIGCDDDEDDEGDD